MNIEACQSKNELDFGELMQALQKVSQTDSSFSGMSLQILKEILCEPKFDVIPIDLSRKRVSVGSLLWHEGDIDNS